jgi:hypothetical protein
MSIFQTGRTRTIWWPKGEGADFTLGRTMQPLEALKRRIQVISGLDHPQRDRGR